MKDDGGRDDRRSNAEEEELNRYCTTSLAQVTYSSIAALPTVLVHLITLGSKKFPK